VARERESKIYNQAFKQQIKFGVVNGKGKRIR
jgi:hypothetical protein